MDVKGAFLATLGSAALLGGCGSPQDPVDSTEAGLSGSASNNQTASGWLTCSNGPGSNCGGAGGVGKIVQTRFDVDVSGGGRSHVADEHTNAGVSYGTSYWYRETGQPTFLATSIDYSTDLYVPSSVGTKYQAIEWDGEQHLGGYLYNYGWQAERNSGRWRWFDYAAGAWRDSGIAFAGFAPDTWHTVHAHYSVDGSTITNDYLEVDGVRQAPTVSTAHQRVAGSGTKMNIGLQLDQDSAGDEMTVYWDNINLSYGDSCGPPVITSPDDDAVQCGSEIHVTTTAPACIVATKCYLQSAGATVVASGGRTLTDVSIPVPEGQNFISCNGWDEAGRPYTSQRATFTRVTCAARPTALQP
jgi:hypothetical protein